MILPEQSSKIAAIFDFDGTLFTGHLWYGLITHHFKYGLKIGQVISYLASHYPLWIMNKLNIIDEEAFKTKWGEDLAVLLKDFTNEEIAQIYSWIDLNYIAGRLRPDTVQLLQDHKQRGHITFIISASFQQLLEFANRRVGADYVLGTHLAMNGHCPGKIEKPLCFGSSKSAVLTQFIDRMGLKIDFEASFAYSDSLTDVPLLKMVGNPVAAYPDKRLEKLAGQNKWKILPT
jgi:HAD superfamily hydrolase (TIGR01490 family)